MAQATYTGKSTTAGNSTALRVESAFFRSHPEARGSFKVKQVGRGQFLFSFDVSQEGEEDPALAAFLSFIDKEMEAGRDEFTPLDQDLLDEIDGLVGPR
jgi:hypothetical protein